MHGYRRYIYGCDSCGDDRCSEFGVPVSDNHYMLISFRRPG